MDRLTNMRIFCKDIVGFIERFGDNYQTFITDRAYYNAVSMGIMQIGELANGLTKEFREKTKEQMQWEMIRGMRNWLAHGYINMSEEIIWETATKDIPAVLEFCDEIIESEKEKIYEE